VILPILQEGPACIVIANRTRATADALVEQFAGQVARAGQVSACNFEDIGAGVPGPFDVVINATSTSLAGTMPPIAASAFGPDTLALDMMYAKKPSPFMDFAASQGALVRDGLGMLVEQAAEVFSIWRGVRPATGEVLAQVRSKL
jgi:shikimate dehydrogenase